MSITCAICRGKGYRTVPLFIRHTLDKKAPNVVLTPCTCKNNTSKRARRALKLIDDQVVKDNAGNYALTNVQLAFVLKSLKSPRPQN